MRGLEGNPAYVRNKDRGEVVHVKLFYLRHSKISFGRVPGSHGRQFERRGEGSEKCQNDVLGHDLSFKDPEISGSFNSSFQQDLQASGRCTSQFLYETRQEMG